MSRTFSFGWLLLIVAVAMLLRLWQIDTLPPGFHFDEAFEGNEAWRILTDPTYRPVFLTGNFGVVPLNAYANALMFGLFERFGGEAGPTAMRVTAAVFGILGVLAVYALGQEMRRLDSRLSAAFPLLSAAALALMRWHIHFSRMGIEPIMVPAIWAGAMALFLHGWRTGRWLAFAASGLLLAAAMYAYQAAWIMPFLMIPLSLHLLLARRQIAAPPRPFAALFVTALVAAGAFAPLGIYIVQNIELVLLRPTQVAVVGNTGSPADQTTLETLWATFAMFSPIDGTGDQDPRRNLPGTPVLALGLLLPFYAGCIRSIWQIRRPIFALPLVGLVGLLLPGALSEYAPHFHRILGASAPTALLCGIGLDWLWQRFSLPDREHSDSRERSVSFWTRLATRVLAIGLLLAGGAVSTYDYFVRWATLPDLFYAFDVGLWDAAQWIASQPGDTPVFITPRNLEHDTLAFALRPRSASKEHPTLPRPVSFDGRHIFPLFSGVAQMDQHYVVIEHEDFRTRLLLPEVFPDAIVTKEILDWQGQVYTRVYTRQAGSIPERQPRVPVAADLGDGIALVGYDLLPERPHPGEILYLQLHWQTSAQPQGDWTVFTHVIAPEGGSALAARDNLPGEGSLPTWRWQAGWRILDEYQISLPSDLPPGEYALRIGLYHGEERLPATTDGIVLGTVRIE